jgi:hypothetical protein
MASHRPHDLFAMFSKRHIASPPFALSKATIADETRHSKKGHSRNEND